MRHTFDLERARALTPIASIAVALVGWLLWLGPHQRRHRIPGTNNFEGPYENWQVVGYAVTLGVFVAIAAWFGVGWIAATATSVAMAVVFSIDAATTPSPDGIIWLPGAFLLLIGSLVGLHLVSLVVSTVRAVLRRVRRAHGV